MKQDAQSDGQHRKLVRFLKGSKDLATFFQTASEDMVIKDCSDGDWGCDELDRKSVSGGSVMVGGGRIHCHSRTTTSHALSSGESKIMSISELLKDCMYIQSCLELCGMGTLPSLTALMSAALLDFGMSNVRTTPPPPARMVVDSDPTDAVKQQKLQLSRQRLSASVKNADK